MPTVTVNREELFVRLGWRCTDEEFDDKCFEFGVELDDVEELLAPKRTLYHIAIAANRTDLLCMEGLARALKCFFSVTPPPVSLVHGVLFLNRLPYYHPQLKLHFPTDLHSFYAVFLDNNDSQAVNSCYPTICCLCSTAKHHIYSRKIHQFHRTTG